MMLPSNPGPIGIFDSGYGGLTILHGLLSSCLTLGNKFIVIFHNNPICVNVNNFFRF